MWLEYVEPMNTGYENRKFKCSSCGAFNRSVQLKEQETGLLSHWDRDPINLSPPLSRWPAIMRR